MLRRLRHHHPSFLARPEHEVASALRRQSAAESRPLREVIWEAYDSTFPPPVARSEYHDWISQVEGPEIKELDRVVPERLAELERAAEIEIPPDC